MSSRKVGRADDGDSALAAHKDDRPIRPLCRILIEQQLLGRVWSVGGCHVTTAADEPHGVRNSRIFSVGPAHTKRTKRDSTGVWRHVFPARKPDGGYFAPSDWPADARVVRTAAVARYRPGRRLVIRTSSPVATTGSFVVPGGFRSFVMDLPVMIYTPAP